MVFPLPHITSRAIAGGCRNRARTIASGDPDGPHTARRPALHAGLGFRSPRDNVPLGLCAAIGFRSCSSLRCCHPLLRPLRSRGSDREADLQSTPRALLTETAHICETSQIRGVGHRNFLWQGGGTTTLLEMRIFDFSRPKLRVLAKSNASHMQVAQNRAVPRGFVRPRRTPVWLGDAGGG